MQTGPSPQSPAERDKQLAKGDGTTIAHRLDHLPLIARAFEVSKRVVVGVFNDGFIHAGNLAYLSLLTLFPFFIVTAALASLLGRNDDTVHAVNSLFVTLPPTVQTVLRQPIHDVLTERTGVLLWIGALLGLWTVGSFIETIRDILRRAYGVRSSLPFWRYRLGSIGIIIVAVILMMAAFSFQVLLTAAEQVVFRLFPFAHDVMGWIQLSRLVPLIVAWGAIYLIMWTLTPSHYRLSKNPKWPGAVLVARSAGTASDHHRARFQLQSDLRQPCGDHHHVDFLLVRRPWLRDWRPSQCRSFGTARTCARHVVQGVNL
jgi:membrane protein